MNDGQSNNASASVIVSQSRRADRSDLAKLMDEFRPTLRAEARQSLDPNLRKRADESDIVQRTLLTAVEEFASFRGDTDAELRAWLRAIQRQHIAAIARQHLALMRNVQREVSPSEDSSPGQEQATDSRARPSRRMQLKELRKQIDDALKDLPEAQQCAVRMKFLDQFSTQEIAEATGQTERAVAGLLRRGMTRLKDVLRGLE